MTQEAGNVVQLPDRAARSWPAVAEGLAAHLVSLGRPPAMVAQVVEELRPEYIAAWEGPTVSAGTDPDDAMQAVNNWVTGFLIRLLAITAEAKLELAERLADDCKAAEGMPG